MGQSRWCLLVAVVLVSVTNTLGSIPSTCIGGVCYSCPDFCSTIKTNFVGTPEATCTCEGSGPDTLCPNTPCTVVDSGSANVGVNTIIENSGARSTSIGSTVMRFCAMVLCIYVGLVL